MHLNSMHDINEKNKNDISENLVNNLMGLN